jgi:hypothetical protein
MLVISNVQSSDAGSYAAIAINMDGLDRSQFANVTVCSNQPCNFPWVWMKTFRGSDTNRFSYVSAMATDTQGNIYVTGSGSGYEKYLTIELGPDGQLLWTATYSDVSLNGDQANSLAVDSAGNCYVTGVSSSWKAPPWEGDNDYLTIKYDTAGEKLWEARYSTPTNGTAEARNDQALWVAVDAAGCAYVTGTHGILKYDAAGNPIWTNSFGGQFIVFSTNDNSVVVGPGFGGSVWGGDRGIKKLSAVGNELWSAPAITNLVAPPRLGSDGSIYAAVAYGYDWLASQGDIQTLKLDTNGVPIWTRFYNSPFNSIEKPMALDIDRDGNVFVAGWVCRTLAPEAQQTGAVDILLLKYSPAGNLLWSVLFNDSANRAEGPLDLRVDQDGNVYIAGSTELEATGQQRAALLLKYDADGNHLWTSRYPTGPGGGFYLRLSIADNGTLVVAGASLFESLGYQEQFLVASFAQNTPRLTMAGVPAPGVRQGCLVSPRGTQFDILANTNLTTTNWQGIGAVTNFNGLVPFFDTDAGQHPSRFYRARMSNP